MMSIGKIFKRKLEQQSFTEQEKNWKAMQERLDVAMPVTEKKRRFLWLFFPIIIGAITFGISKYGTTKNNTTVAAKNEISAPKISTSENKIISKLPTHETQNRNITSQNIIKETKITNAKKPIKIGNTDNENSQLRNNDAINLNNRKVERKNIVAISKPKTEIGSPEKTALNSSIQNKKDKQNLEKLNPNNVSIAENENINDYALLATTENGNKFDFAQNPSPIIINKTVENKLPNIKAKNEENNDSLSPESKKVGDATKPATPPDYSVPIKAKQVLSVNVYAGYMLCGKYIYKANNVHTEYLEKRKLEEKNAATFTFGADVNYTYKHLIFTTGINYNTQAEKRNYTNQFYRDVTAKNNTYDLVDNSYYQYNQNTVNVAQVQSTWVTTQDTINYYNTATNSYASAIVNIQNYVVTGTNNLAITTQDSTLVTKIDTIKNINISTINKKIIDNTVQNTHGTNKISYIEIPLLVGYKFQLNKMSLALQTGVGIGFLNKQKTYYINNRLSDIEETKSENFNKIMYNYLLCVSANYSLTKNWGIVFQPNFRTNINSVTKKNTTFQQKYWNVGGNVGVSYTW